MTWRESPQNTTLAVEYCSAFLAAPKRNHYSRDLDNFGKQDRKTIVIISVDLVLIFASVAGLIGCNEYLIQGPRGVAPRGVAPRILLHNGA